MTSRRTVVPIEFSKPGVQPPVYLAGSFSDPAWQPQEMRFTVDDQNQHRYHKEVEVEEGKEYQYKFRIGNGDWWMLDEDSPTATDDAGNRNNILAVSIHQESTETGQSQQSSKVSAPSATLDKMDPELETKGDTGAKASMKDDKKPTYASVVARQNHVEPDNALTRDQTSTPELANVAAEVADAATILDKEPPTPPIPDEEAGRIGFRRMSLTPIPDVAATAAEVAESAAIIDDEDEPDEDEQRLQMPPIYAMVPGDEMTESGTVTPWEDRAPLFAHECVQRPETEDKEPGAPETPGAALGQVETSIDPNDPTIEAFPSERRLILESVRTSASRLNEDETAIETSSSSVIGPEPYVERLGAPSPSPHLETSGGSLDSIPEDSNREEAATSDELDNEGPGPSIDGHEVSPREIVSPKEGPTDTVESATPGASLKAQSSDEPFEQSVENTAATSGIEEGGDPTQLTKRKAPSPAAERPATPSSTRPTGQDAKSKGFLRSFLSLIFVDWIGGLITRICGGDRHALLAMTALVLVTVPPAVYLYYLINSNLAPQYHIPHAAKTR